jgi:hypothetical protein
MVKTNLGRLLLSMALLVSLPAFGVAEDEDGQGKCSLKTIKGAFGVLEQGSVVGQLPGLPAPPFPFAIVGVDSYDGRGNLTGSFTASFNGATLSGTLNGTYTVNSDCTYSDQFTTSLGGPALHRSGSISGEAPRQVSFIYTDALYTSSPFTASGTAKETPEGECSLRTVKGVYVGAGQAIYTVSQWGFTAPFPAAWSSLFTIDVAGHYSGNGSLNLSGLNLPLPFQATYTVDPDCTFHDIVTNPYGTGKGVGVITGVGRSQEIRMVLEDPNAVTVATFWKQ